MRKKSDKEKKHSAVTKSGEKVVRPFTELPSHSRLHEGPDAKQKLQASDLFSLFTANIIKEDKVFTR